MRYILILLCVRSEWYEDSRAERNKFQLFKYFPTSINSREHRELKFNVLKVDTIQRERQTDRQTETKLKLPQLGTVTSSSVPSRISRPS
jgi:hypothetical protein